MHDAYKSREQQLQDAMKSFPLVQGQSGILVFFNNKVAGMDIMSKATAYTYLHNKLVKSYLIDCLDMKGSSSGPDTLKVEAEVFLDKLSAGTYKSFKSKGLGDDYRVTAPDIQGSSLVYNDDIIHSCYFSIEREDGHMAGFNRRNQLFV